MALICVLGWSYRNFEWKCFIVAYRREYCNTDLHEFELSVSVSCYVFVNDFCLFPMSLQHLRNQYEQLFPVLYENYPDVFPPELYTWEQFLWACELWYSNSMKIMFSDGKLRTCLIPVAGFLNHSVCQNFSFPAFLPLFYLSILI